MGSLSPTRDRTRWKGPLSLNAPPPARLRDTHWDEWSDKDQARAPSGRAWCYRQDMWVLPGNVEHKRRWYGG